MSQEPQIEPVASVEVMSEVNENPVTVSTEGKLERPIVHEDKFILNKKIDSLKEQIEEYANKLQGAKNSEAVHGVKFSTLVGNVEVTEELLDQKKSELAEAQSLKQSLKPKREEVTKNLMKTLKNFLSL